MDMVDMGVIHAKSSVVKHHHHHGHKDTRQAQYPAFDLMPSEMHTQRCYYGVRIVTGETAGAGAGTGADIFVTLIGSEATTQKVSIHNYLKRHLNGVSSCTCEDLIVESEGSLGEVLVVVLGIDGGKHAMDHTWFVNYTVVKDLATSTEVEFPCYHWIGKGQIISSTSKTTTLKDIQGNDVLKRERQNHLELKKGLYHWHLFPETGLPSGIDTTVKKLPLDEEFGRVKDVDFTVDVLKGFISAKGIGMTITIKRLADYIDFNKCLGETELIHSERAGRWTSDVEFGRQILNGVNPVVIWRCTEIPAKFPVTNEMVQPFFTRGMTLEQEMEAGHVYICDMAIMDGLPTRDGQFAAAPICLLYVNSAKQLVPIAIQLKQGVREEEKGQPNPIFLSSDHWNDWLLAKTYYKEAASQHHQLSTHYQSCHATMEAYAMGTLRNLPDAHPIHKLLVPHFRYTMAINSRARKTLINDGGIIDQIFAIGTKGKIEFLHRASKSFSVDWTNIKKFAKTRGVDDPEKLPGYYYRDDGLKVFNAIEEFVRDVVNAFYTSDEDVETDSELQSWADDIYTNGFPSYFGGKQGHDFPQKICCKEELIERCTVIIFTGSAQHASINFGQYQFYAFVPNAPFTMRRPPPCKKGITDYQSLLDSLPDGKAAESSIGITYALSQYSRDELFLGDYPFKRFTESNVLNYIERFQRKLEGIGGEIDVRNESLDVPYTYMLPKKIPNSITI